jgi:hypothetical protein
MIIINDIDYMYRADPSRYHDWERFQAVANDCIFFNGHMNNIKMSVDPAFPKILFFGEEQIWERDTTDHALPFVDKILTSCSPKITGRQKRVSAFFPQNEELINTNISLNKQIDVVYAGYSGGEHVRQIIESIVKYNYSWISYGDDPRITHRGVNHLEKMALISHSKISVCHGLTGTGTPQTKTRFFESAVSKSLILCMWDNWNCIEEWYEPNVDFLYFRSQAELNLIISDVIQNFDRYIPVINSAYEKTTREYTTYKFVEKYIGFKSNADLTPFKVF